MPEKLDNHQWKYAVHNIFLKTVVCLRYVHSHIKRIWIFLIYSLLSIAGVVVFGILVVLINQVTWALYTTIPEFGVLQNRHVADSTKLYDRTGTVLLYDTTGSMRRTIIPLEDISPHLKNATIAIEDQSFYTHSGVRYDAIIRAFLNNIESASFEQGGSTITQQLIKNTLLTDEKRISRKLKEFVLALRIEKMYSKDEILQTYLNETTYGGTLYGVEEASQAFFNKPAKEVTLGEAAYIASLPKAPTYFSPWGNHRDALDARHDLVLRKMAEQKLISKEEYERALMENVTFASQSSENIKAPHFVFYVLEELEKEFEKEKVYNGQLQVVTTLDWEMQQENEKIIQEGALKNEKKFNASNAGLVVINPKNGQVLAMVGSRNYFDDSVDGQVNVTTSLRQPGSSFKPFVYATAFKKGYTPDTVLFDLKTQFSTACAPSNFSAEYPCYVPENYDGKYKGPMTLRDALAQSVNTVGVKTLYLSGIEDSLATAQSLGITTLKDAKRYGLTLVLGGGEVQLLEMTSAYGAFANDGILYPPTPFLSIRTPKGETVPFTTSTPKHVLAPEVARAINDILSDNDARTPAFGAASPLYFENRVVASKTGTTNDYRDMWVIGYTPEVVVGTWAGNSDNTPMVKSVASFILAPIWRTAMEKTLEHFSTTSSFIAYQKDTVSVPTSMLAGSTFYDPAQGVHEIFYWIHRNKVHLGGETNPYQDPQIAHWGYPVALWASEQARLALASSTSALLGISGAGGVPLQMSIVTPVKSSVVQKNKPFTATIHHSDMGTLEQVSYYLHGEYVGDSTKYPFSITITPKKEGVTVLRAVAKSPLGNKEALTTFTVGNVTREEKQTISIR